MKRGRPSVPDAERCRSTSLWLTPPRIAKLRKLGGSKWVSGQIDEHAPDGGIVIPFQGKTTMRKAKTQKQPPTQPYATDIETRREAIHHIDGNPLNNDLSNLTVIDANLKRYRQVPSTGVVTREEAIAYALEEWPNDKEYLGIEWRGQAGRHTMTWDQVRKDQL